MASEGMYIIVIDGSWNKVLVPYQQGTIVVEEQKAHFVRGYNDSYGTV